MPAGDGTGPLAMGPMTGRAAGFCAGYGVPGYLNAIPGRGLGMGYGRGCGGGRGRFAAGPGGGGRGWRHMAYATGLPGWQRGAGAWPARGAVPPPPALSREQQVAELKKQAEYFKGALSDLTKWIEELETDKVAK